MIVSVLLLSHVLGDFVFQSEALTTAKAYDKNNKRRWLKAQLMHIYIHLLILLILGFVVGISLEIDTLILLGGYLLSHLLIDIVKSILHKGQNTYKKKLVYYLLDQVLHLLILFGIAQLIFSGTLNVSSGDIFYFLDQSASDFKDYFSILFLALYVVYSGGVFVPLSLNMMYSEYLDKYGEPNSKPNIGKKISELSIHQDIKDIDDNQHEEYTYLYSKVSVGKYIGMMERFLIFIGLLVGNYTLIIGVIGIKTWVRHKEFSKRNFSEYYLLGSMLSIVYSFIAFYSINIIFELIRIPFNF